MTRCLVRCPQAPIPPRRCGDAALSVRSGRGEEPFRTVCAKLCTDCTTLPRGGGACPSHRLVWGAAFHTPCSETSTDSPCAFLVVGGFYLSLVPLRV